MRKVLCLAACLMATPALLPSSASAESVVTRVGETPAALTFADGLSAYPDFDAFLRDDAQAAAEDYALEDAKSFKLVDRITHDDGRYVSVLRRTEADLGALRPNVYVEGLAWDGEAKDFVRLDAFFDRGEARDDALIAISHAIREAIRYKVWDGLISEAYKPLVAQATSPDPAVLANFTFAKGGRGLVFHFSPREVAPYEKGAAAVPVPKSVFAEHLNEAGEKVFK